MSIEALFVNAASGKHPKCLSTVILPHDGILLDNEKGTADKDNNKDESSMHHAK